MIFKDEVASKPIQIGISNPQLFDNFDAKWHFKTRIDISPGCSYPVDILFAFFSIKARN